MAHISSQLEGLNVNVGSHGAAWPYCIGLVAALLKGCEGLWRGCRGYSPNPRISY